jgi:hypothetical protein
MEHFICLADGSVDGIVLAVDTRAQIKEAQQLMCELGVKEAPIWIGCGDEAVKTRMVVLSKDGE